MSFKPSPYQQAFFDWIHLGSGSASVNAVAGSGKTTTMVQAQKLIPASARVLFLAFNKKIAMELEQRVPSHVKAATFHSQGFASWRRHRESSKIEGSKVRDIARTALSPMEADAFGAIACKLVSLAKNSGFGALVDDTEAAWLNLADHYDVELSSDEQTRLRTIAAARNLLKLSVEQANAEKSVIDFDDMLYMPLLVGSVMSRYDWVFVDEAQDTNSVQLALLRRMLKPGGRLVAVGDPRQAIYGFRGADASAMENIVRAFDCKELPLTISYRCSKAVVALAKTIVPAIEASASAPEGEVIRSLSVKDAKFTNTDAIICRNTAPIVELAYDFIGRGIGCKVLGREIGAALVQLIDKMRTKDVDALLSKLDDYAAREVAKFTQKGQEDRAEAVKDRVECVRAIISYLPETTRTIAGAKRAIESMFSDTGDGLLTLCTAHKSKGLEWDRVFIYRPELMPSKWARQQWQKDQEANLQYVAWTRAKHTLVFLSSGKSAPVVTLTREQKIEAMRKRCAELNPNDSDHFWNDTP